MKYGLTKVAFCSLVVLLGCSSNSEEPKQPPEISASVSYLLGGAAFEGKSVQICGARTPPATSGVLCQSSLPCRCYTFDESGTPIDPDTSAPLIVNGLCASSETPTGNWTFDYSVFSNDSCDGSPINGPGGDIVCYDSRDLATKAHPNQSVEPLEKGLNENHVICIAQNANKTWNFALCSDNSNPSFPDQSRYACGCTLVDDRCDCGPGGVRADDLEAGCRFDATTCDIVCESTNQFACDNTIFLSSTPFGGGVPRTDLGAMSLELTVTPIATTTKYAYDAIAFNPADNHIYGIANTVDGAPGANHLLEIDSRGVITDHGTSGLSQSEEWIVGTFTAPDIYVVGSFGATTLQRLNVATSTITPLPLSPTTGVPLAMAYRPDDGLIWGYGPFTGGTFSPTLVTINPTTGTVVTKANFSGSIGSQACSAAVTKDDRYLLLCRPPPGSPSPIQVQLWEVTNLDTTPTATLLEERTFAEWSKVGRTTTAQLNAGNLATCPF